jgi:hypothetical protein
MHEPITGAYVKFDIARYLLFMLMAVSRPFRRWPSTMYKKEYCVTYIRSHRTARTACETQLAGRAIAEWQTDITR